MRRIATAMLLLAVLTPGMTVAFAAQQLTETAPMLEHPVLSFDGTVWRADSLHPADYLVGMTRTPGMAEGEAAVIAARPTAGRDSSGGVAQSIPAAEWRGKRVRLTARLKTQDATEVQVILRVAAGSTPHRQVSQAMATFPVSGTREWHAREIVIEIPDDAQEIVYGFSLRGRGAAFGDSFRLEAVGRNVALTRAPGLSPQFRSPGMVRSYSGDTAFQGGVPGYGGGQ